MVIGTLGEMDSGLSFLLIVLCLVMLSVTMLRRTQQRRATARELTREQLARLRDQKEVHTSMDELLVQLEEVSRRINAQVDTRFVKLETVIRDADERVARLEALVAGKSPAEALAASKSAEEAPTIRSGDSEAKPPPPANPSSSDATDIGSAPQPADAPQVRQPTSPSRQRERIYELADAGTSAITIADSLQMPVGEVELILSLRKFK